MVALTVCGLQGDLLNPCRCDGSVRHTHQRCLLKWISERGCWTCELCCYRFQVAAIRLKRPWQVSRVRRPGSALSRILTPPLPPLQWQAVHLSLVEKVQTVALVLGSLFLLASVSWLLWSALSPQALWQRRDLLFQICYGMYGFMDLVCIGGSRRPARAGWVALTPGSVLHQACWSTRGQRFAASSCAGAPSTCSGTSRATTRPGTWRGPAPPRPRWPPGRSGCPCSAWGPTGPSRPPSSGPRPGPACVWEPSAPDC